MSEEYKTICNEKIEALKAVAVTIKVGLLSKGAPSCSSFDAVVTTVGKALPIDWQDYVNA